MFFSTSVESRSSNCPSVCPSGFSSLALSYYRITSILHTTLFGMILSVFGKQKFHFFEIFICWPCTWSKVGPGCKKQNKKTFQTETGFRLNRWSKFCFFGAILLSRDISGDIFSFFRNFHFPKCQKWLKWLKMTSNWKFGSCSRLDRSSKFCVLGVFLKGNICRAFFHFLKIFIFVPRRGVQSWPWNQNPQKFGSEMIVS